MRCNQLQPEANADAKIGVSAMSVGRRWYKRGPLQLLKQKNNKQSHVGKIEYSAMRHIHIHKTPT
ncbi:MAG TPA: hypothetical protein VLH35_08160 [Candidatus Acidoferrales bacterium]|nr:hypothetical protein [Candidatus Acidoferrales bacterium]